MQATPESCDRWQLVAGRLFASIATIGGLAIFAFAQLYSRYRHWQLGRMRDHTLVITLGERGRAFLQSLTDRTVVTLDLNPSEWPVPAAGMQLLETVGDGTNESNLRAVNAGAAARVLILGDNDAANLQTLRMVLGAPRTTRARQDVIVRIDNPILARGLNAQDSFARPRNDVRVLAFNEDRVAAIRFNDAHPLAELADRRGVTRVHHVIIGFTPFALAALEQFVRIAPYKDFTHPRIDFFVDDVAALELHYAAHRPVFLSCAFRHDSQGHAERIAPVALADELAPLLELHIWPSDPGSGLPAFRTLAEVEPGPEPSVTSILVNATHDGDAIATAMRLREMTLMSGRWTAPVFVRSRSDSAVTELQRDLRASGHDPQFQIVPVGLRRDTCSAEACFGARETQAERLHHAYLETLRMADAREAMSQGETPDAAAVPQAKPSDRPWPQLSETFRARNRRAVDHLLPKVLSAGFVVTGRPLRAESGLWLESAPHMLDRLAALEHAAWESDLRTDGWRGGTIRDDARLVHDCIGVGYNRLSPLVQSFDLNQVILADRILRAKQSDVPTTVLKETCLGLFGHNMLTREELALLVASVPGQLESLFGGTQRPECVSILTPLAPGADTVLTELALTWLSDHSVTHRLIVVRSLPRIVVARLYRSSAAPELRWSMHENTGQSSADDIVSRLASLELPGRTTVREPFRLPTVLADLQRPGSELADWFTDEALQTQAFQKANAYLARRADVVLAYVDARRTTHREGGAAEALAWARDRTLIPASLHETGVWRSSGPAKVLVVGEEQGATMLSPSL
jgi:hypothetical protein